MSAGGHCSPVLSRSSAWLGVAPALSSTEDLKTTVDVVAEVDLPQGLKAKALRNRPSVFGVLDAARVPSSGSELGHRPKIGDRVGWGARSGDMRLLPRRRG